MKYTPNIIKSNDVADSELFKYILMPIIHKADTIDD